ncbi:MAG: hypothetical protein WAU24_00225, partial [Chitinophagaceae bacterium]
MKKNYTYLLLFVTILLLRANRVQAQVDVNDSLAMVALYNSTDGPNWIVNTNWLSTKPLGSWYGLTVENNRLTAVYQSGNNLNGSLPKELNNTNNLSALILSFNKLSGKIPPEFGNFSKLY